jgi:hypothetical protein
MTVLTWPSALLPSTFRLTQVTNQRVYASPFGGSEQTFDMLNDRWLISMDLPVMAPADAAAIEGFLNSFRGQTNTVAIGHAARPTPLGKMRGAMALAMAAPQGAGTIVITSAGQAGKTLLAGDLLGLGGLLLMVAADCTADGSGTITVPLTNRLRAAQSAAAPVSWNRPTANFRLVTSTGVQYIPGMANAVSLEFAEAI